MHLHSQIANVWGRKHLSFNGKFCFYFCFLLRKVNKTNLKFNDSKILSSKITTLAKLNAIMSSEGCYAVPEIWHMTDVIVSFHSKKSKLKKKTWKKTPGDIILHRCTKNYDQWFLRHGERWTDRETDRQMDRWKKWHTQVGAPPKNWTVYKMA